MKRHFTILLVMVLTAALLCGCSTGPVQAETQSPQAVNEAAAALVLDIPTTQYFTHEAVAAEDIDAIMMAGSNAPSAMNGQPWHFSVITDPAVMEEISGGMSFGGAPAGMGEMPEGFAPPQDGEAPGGEATAEGAAIPEGVPDGTMSAPPAGGAATKAGVGDSPLVIVISCKAGSEFDAGLACQNMSVEAQLLGYGTKIISSATMTINAEGNDALRTKLGIPEGYSACALLLVGKEDTTVDTTVDTYTGATERNALEEMATYLVP